VNLVLEELFTNSIRHGGCEGMPRVAEVRLETAGDDVRVEYRDRGRPFDPTGVPGPHPPAQLEERIHQGMGLRVVRGIMAGIGYERRGDWNRLAMRRAADGIQRGGSNMIQVTTEMRSGWCVVGVRGRADGHSADELETALRAAVEQNARVAADFSALDYISSAGLRALLETARSARERGTEFAVCRLSAPVTRVFDISGMRQLLQVRGELPG
jgi:anti-anti-sigma factor